MNPELLFMAVLFGILIYLGVGMWIATIFGVYDQDIQCAVIVLWPVMIILGFVWLIFAILKSVVVGCVKLVMEVFD